MFRSSLTRALWAACSPLRKARRQSKMPASAIAGDAGVAENTLRAYERGIRNAPVNVIYVVASYAKINPALLICDYQVWSALRPEEETSNQNGEQQPSAGGSDSENESGREPDSTDSQEPTTESGRPSEPSRDFGSECVEDRKGYDETTT